MNPLKEELVYEQKMDEITVQIGRIYPGCNDRRFTENRKKKS
jgi:hypothetical protein